MNFFNSQSGVLLHVPLFECFCFFQSYGNGFCVNLKRVIIVSVSVTALCCHSNDLQEPTQISVFFLYSGQPFYEEDKGGQC